MSTIEYVFLDFDGTIMVYDEGSGFFHPSVIRLLNRMGEKGVHWCTNSGRDMNGQWEILKASMRKGLNHLPEAMLCAESYIYEHINGRYIPADPWNRRAKQLSQLFHRRVQARLLPQLTAWSKSAPLERVYIQDEATVFLVSDMDDAPARFMARLSRLVKDVPDGQVTRNGGWVVALPSALGKGGILRSYLHSHQISSKATLAIGDHLNDLSMLDGSAAGHVGCPADANLSVISAVKAAGGMVAGAEGPLGTIDVIKHYLQAVL